jgi:hypothetical protein
MEALEKEIRGYKGCVDIFIQSFPPLKKGD